MLVEYGIYKIPITLTNNDISAIVTAYRSRACTVKETSSDSKGNSYDVFLILQGYTTQYALAPKVDDVEKVLENALIRVGAASGVANLNSDVVRTGVAQAEEVTVDDIEGPWKDVSAESHLLVSCLAEVRALKGKLRLFDKSYSMLIKADSTPEASVLAIPKLYDPIDRVAAKSASFTSIPSDIAGYDVLAVTGDLSEEDKNNLKSLEVSRVVFNSLQLFNELFSENVSVRTVTANYLQYNPDLGDELIQFVGEGGVSVLCVDKGDLPDGVVSLVDAITPEGDSYPVVFGCNVNGYPMLWDLVGFGIKYPDNLPNSYKNNEVINRSLKLYNLCINVIPLLGWGPLESKVKNFNK